MSGVKPDEMIGQVLLEGGTHAVVLVDGYGAPVLRLNGARYPMKRPSARELGQMFLTASKHEPHRGVRSDHR